jgi:uncharacterized protein
MRAAFCSLGDLALSMGRPNVGDLMTLCEENYVLLARLAPHLKDLHGCLVSRRKGSVDLYMTIEEQARYTTRVRLTHWFPGPDRGWGTGRPTVRAVAPVEFGPDPDACLCVYHDARQVEVLDLRESLLPMRVQYEPPALDAKWRANLFLGKWLTFCLQQGHRFVPSTAGAVVCEDGDLLYTLT